MWYLAPEQVSEHIVEAVNLASGEYSPEVDEMALGGLTKVLQLENHIDPSSDFITTNPCIKML